MTSKIFLKSMRHLWLMGVVVLLGFLAPSIALAEDLMVDGGEILNVSSDIIYDNETIGDVSQGTLTQTSGVNRMWNSLTLGKQATGIGTYNLSGTGVVQGGNIGQLGREYWIIGDAGQGTFNQTGGSCRTFSLTLGNQSTGSGTYILEGNSRLQTERLGNVVIGNLGTGTFTQNGGDFATYLLYIGRYSGSTGTYSQNGGTMAVRGETGNLYVGNELGSSGTYNLSGNGSLSVNMYEYIGKSGTGTFTQSGNSTHEVQFLSLGGLNSTYTLKDSARLTVSNLGISNSSTFTQTGGTVSVASFLSIAGTYNLQGGELAATNLSVSGNLNLTGVTLGIYAYDTTVYYPGTVRTTNASVSWGGLNGFNLSGAYISNQSNQTFANLTVKPTGYLMAASQDMFIMRDNFENRSTLNNLWDTQGAKLTFITGPDSDHNLYVPGAELGLNGYEHNFAWGSLNLTGQILHLFDGNAVSGGSLYVGEILGVNYTDLLVNNILMGENGLNLNIYYNPNLSGNAYLRGLTYDLTGGGQLIPTPLPASVLLLGSGLLGLGLLGWGRRRG